METPLVYRRVASASVTNSKLLEAYEGWLEDWESTRETVKLFVDAHVYVDFKDHGVLVTDNEIIVHGHGDINEMVEHFTKELEKIGHKVYALDASSSEREVRWLTSRFRVDCEK